MWFDPIIKFIEVQSKLKSNYLPVFRSTFTSKNILVANSLTICCIFEVFIANTSFPSLNLIIVSCGFVFKFYIICSPTIEVTSCYVWLYSVILGRLVYESIPYYWWVRLFLVLLLINAKVSLRLRCPFGIFFFSSNSMKSLSFSISFRSLFG